MDNVASVVQSNCIFPRNLESVDDGNLLGDIWIKIITNDLLTGLQKEERILAHRLVIAAASPFLRALVQAALADTSTHLLSLLPCVELHLGAVPNAVQAFKVILSYLYTGNLVFGAVDPVQVLQVARICRVSVVEVQVTFLLTQSLLRQREGKAAAPTLPSPPSVDFRWLLAMHLSRVQNAGTATAAAPASIAASLPAEGAPLPESGTITASRPLSTCLPVITHTGDVCEKDDSDSPSSALNLRSPASVSACSSRTNGSVVDGFSDVIVPSNDKEGWCRNKKYIERVANGFMCTVCRKIYGRYNSVSYHVTIYHRNPPIKCDEEGCQFTTREARYIHFHKYYRHHIALPESIDLGSRKCPFCRHVSKSPAMLEKHINRHLPECTRVGRLYKCPQCATTTESNTQMYEHVTTQHENTYQCNKCSYRGRTANNLAQHTQFKHSNEMFKRSVQCVECSFRCACEDALAVHYERMHRANPASEDESVEGDAVKGPEEVESGTEGVRMEEEEEEEEEPICLVTRKENSL